MSTAVDQKIATLREEKDPIQRAKTIHYLHVDREITLKQISEKLELHPSYISHYLRLLHLPTFVLDGYYAKQISTAHLFILSRLKEEKDIIKAYQAILAKNLTSAETEELIREIKFTIPTTADELTKDEKAELVAEINEYYPEAKIKIIQSKIRGKITLELEGESQQTTTFLKNIVDKITKKAFAEAHDDTLQVLE